MKTILSTIILIFFACGCGSKADKYVKTGNDKFDSGEYEAAIDLFTEAIHLSPNAELFNSRGLAKLMKKDYLGAIDDINKAIELDPKLKTAYLNRAAVKSSVGDYLVLC